MERIKYSMPDCCAVCLDREDGGGPRFPFAWRIQGDTIEARYSCGRCGARWSCWWDARAVGVADPEAEAGVLR